MTLNPQQITSNWSEFISIIKTHISGDRGDNLVNFYNSIRNQIITMPASSKDGRHSSFPGGHIYHTLKVVQNCLDIHQIWLKAGADVSKFTTEELVFAAINHDLGKIGQVGTPLYIPNTSKWHVENRGEHYQYNTKLPYGDVPTRSLFLLQEAKIEVTWNEYLAIKIHDGLYDEGNKNYFMSYTPENKLRNCMPYILHQADIMAYYVEFEDQFLSKLNK